MSLIILKIPSSQNMAKEWVSDMMLADKRKGERGNERCDVRGLLYRHRALLVQDEGFHGSSIQWDGLGTSSSGLDDKFDILFIFECY